MDNMPEITVFPTPGTQFPPVNNIDTPIEPPKIKSFTITVARTEEALHNHFIVTFAKKGPLTCQELLKNKSTLQLLNQAESEGVEISEPAMLASVDDDGIARTIFITPVPKNNIRDFSVWVGQVIETIANIKSQQVGFYLCKNSLTPDELADLVTQVGRTLVEAKIVRDISLIVGQHAYNEVLALALQLKLELDGPDASVHVLH